MSFDNEEQKAACIEQGIRSPFWTEYLVPLLTAKAKNVFRQLVYEKDGRGDDILRGKYQGYDDILTSPQRDIEVYRREAKTRELQAVQQERYDERARMGYQAPFSQPAEPGELKEGEE